MSKKNERIEEIVGEFYRAVSKDRRVWIVKRLDSPAGIVQAPVQGENTTRDLIELLDGQARHWIEHTQAQSQGLREAAKEVVACAQVLEALLPDVDKRSLSNGAVRGLRNLGIEIEALAAALSNNPQVSEPMPLYLLDEGEDGIGHSFLISKTIGNRELATALAEGFHSQVNSFGPGEYHFELEPEPVFWRRTDEGFEDCNRDDTDAHAYWQVNVVEHYPDHSAASGPCKTCGGTGRLAEFDGTVHPDEISGFKPCPDCATPEVSEGSEAAIEDVIREIAGHPLVGGGFVIDPSCGDIRIHHECTSPSDLIAGPKIGSGKTLAEALANALGNLDPAALSEQSEGGEA